MPIFKQHLHYLGHLISEKGIQLLPDKILRITNLALPKDVDEPHHFLGLTGFYRKSIPLYTDRTKPLNNLLQKDTKLQWSTQCKAAFDHLKNALCKKPIIHHPNINMPYTLFKDASNHAFLAFSIR